LNEYKVTLAENTESANNPGLQFESNNYTILVGRNSKESDKLLRKYVKGNDSWLHVRDFPGSHVFIKNKAKKSIPLEVLLDAANLALHFSKAKNSSSADLYVTQVKYLRRSKHGLLGSVIPTQEKNLHIKLDPERISKFLGDR